MSVGAGARFRVLRKGSFRCRSAASRQVRRSSRLITYLPDGTFEGLYPDAAIRAALRELAE